METIVCQAHFRFFKGIVHRSLLAFKRKHPVCCVTLHKNWEELSFLPSNGCHARNYCVNNNLAPIVKYNLFNIPSSMNLILESSKSISSIVSENKISLVGSENLAVISYLEEYLQEKDNKFDVNDVKKLASNLEAVAYAELSDLPWLRVDNIAIAFMQLVMNSNINESFLNLQNQESFKLFCQFIEENLELIPQDDYSRILLSLIYLGTDLTQPLIHKLLIRIDDLCLDMDVHNLITTTQILRTFRTRNIPMVEKLTARFFTLLGEYESGKTISSECMQDFLIGHIFLNLYMSKTGSENVAKRLLGLFLTSDLKSDTDVISMVIRYKHRMQWTVSSKLLASVSPVIVKHITETVNNFDPKSIEPNCIGLYCQYLRQMNLYNGHVVSVFQKHSLDLLKTEGLLVRDIIALLPAFDKLCSSEMKMQLVNILSRHVGDADVLILSSLADFMLKSNIYNQELMVQVQTRTLEIFDTMFDFISRFKKILHLLSTRLNDNEVFHNEFFEKLLKLVEIQHGVRIYVVSLISQYILPNVKHVVPQCLMDRLYVVIPQCDLSAIRRILSGLNHIKRPWDRQLHHQVLELRTALQRNMLHQIENVSTLDRLIQQITFFYIKNSWKDFQLLERMMSEMPRMTASLTSVDFTLTVQLLNTITYHTPEVFENLTDFVLDNKDDVSFKDLGDFLSVISQARYTPSRMDELSQCCHDNLIASFQDEESDILAQMQYAYRLCCLQIGSDDLLTHVFTIDYLEKVDKLVEAKPEVRNHIEDLFFRLNRCVVLEYPHLDIPWFHEDYCSTKKPEPMYRSSYKLVMEVEDAIKDVLGNSSFFESSVYTPYHHFLNFECLLNSDGKPIPYPETSSLLNSEGRLITFTQSSSLSAEQIQHQRVAILVLFEKDYCLNSRILKGDVYLRRRHLEIMGYKVVEIPHYTWNSMALSDWIGKTGYLRERILGIS